MIRERYFWTSRRVTEFSLLDLFPTTMRNRKQPNRILEPPKMMNCHQQEHSCNLEDPIHQPLQGPMPQTCNDEAPSSPSFSGASTPRPSPPRWKFGPLGVTITVALLAVLYTASHQPESQRTPRMHYYPHQTQQRSQHFQAFQSTIPHHRPQRREEEGEDDHNNDKEGEEEDRDSRDENEDEEEQAEDDDNNPQNGFTDDFFGEGLADDYIQENNIDDFYAFYEEPGPPRLFPLEENEIIGYCIASAALTLGASGGIGGGGIVVPVYLLVMGFQPKVAIPIGAVTVLGGATSSTIVNLYRRHPLADRPIIDWDFVLVMQPVVLIGVILGTFLHQLLSEQVLIVLLVVFLSATAHSTLSKAMRMYEAEKRYIRHLKAAQAEPPSGSPSRTFTWGDAELHTPAKPPAFAHSPTVDEEEKERILIENPDFVTLKSDLIEEEKVTPSSKSK